MDHEPIRYRPERGEESWLSFSDATLVNRFVASDSRTGTTWPAEITNWANDAPASAAAFLPGSPLASIDWGTRLGVTVVDVYFAPAGVAVDGVVSHGWSSYEIGQAMLALEQVSKVANIQFRQTYSQIGAEFRLVTLDFGDPGYLSLMYPPGTAYAGNAAFNYAGYGWQEDQPGTGALERGGRGFATLIHEFGHGVGLAHPHDNGGSSTVMAGVTAPFDSYGVGGLNQGVFTTMSYNTGWATGPAGLPPSIESNYGFEASMMALDIAVIQSKYGANLAYRSGDDVYLLPQQNALGTFFESIWDAGGTDEIRNDGTLGAIIDLRPATLVQAEGGGGFVSYAAGIRGGFTIASGVTIERATGGSGADRLTGNDAANVLDGGAGDDVLAGRGGDDTMRGGTGTDTAVFAVDVAAVSVEFLSDRLIVTGEGVDTLYDDIEYFEFNGIAYDREGLAAATGQPQVDATITGTEGRDLLLGGPEAELVLALAGDDIVKSDGGNDVIRADDGNDIVLSGDGDDTVFGGAGNDVIKTSMGRDLLRGEHGDDFLQGWRDDDSIDGGAGNDTIYGDFDEDRIEGGPGADRIVGGPGRDCFVFRDGFEEDRIFGYNTYLEKLDFTGHSGVAGFEDLTVAQVSTHTVVTDGSGGRIVLVNVAAATISEGDFLFA